MNYYYMEIIRNMYCVGNDFDGLYFWEGFL